jgi:hypothetical protein
MTVVAKAQTAKSLLHSGARSWRELRCAIAHLRIHRAACSVVKWISGACLASPGMMSGAVAPKLQFSKEDQADLGDPALRAKIFRFRRRPNHPHNSARLTADEGRWPSSRTRGEMRWTRELRLTCAAQAYGEVVWSRRRGAGVKFSRSKLLRSDGGKKAVHRGATVLM